MDDESYTSDKSYDNYVALDIMYGTPRSGKWTREEELLWQCCDQSFKESSVTLAVEPAERSEQQGRAVQRQGSDGQRVGCFLQACLP